MGKCFTVVLFLLITNCLLLSSLSVNRSYYSDNDDGDAIDTNRTSFDGAQNNESASLLSLLLKPKQKRQAVDLVKKDFFNFLESAQLKLSEKDLECMPGSVFYNGTCIFVSSKRQKLSWIHAERFCRKLPLNTSFLLFENNHKFEFIRNEMIRLRERENPIDQLVFYVGFRYQNNEWKWANNKSLTNTNLTLGKYWWDWSGSHGDCGSIALLKNNEMIMRSAPCLSTSNRFICEYNLNPCYKNDVCGPRGRCVNLYYRFYCDCTVSLFFEGKYCEKLNAAGIQAIIGLIVVGFLVLGIFCNSEVFNRVWHYFCGKKRPIAPSVASAVAGDHRQSGGVEYADGKSATTREKSKNFRSISREIRRSLSRIMQKFYTHNIPYLILTVLTGALVFVQIVFTHSFIEIETIRDFKKSSVVKGMCKNLNDYYMFEDLIYLPFSLLFLLFLYLFLQSSRFNKYIMVKYRNYFRSNIFKEVQDRYAEEYKKVKKRKEDELKEKACGNCRWLSYKCVTHKFCNIFCCLFCCSCCVPPGSNTRCFVWYCCCLGWQQTDFYKVLRTIGNIITAIFYYGLGCPIWKRLWLLTKKKREEREKRKKAIKERRKRMAAAATIGQPSAASTSSMAANSRAFASVVDDDESVDLDLDEDFDVDDYDPETQNLNRGMCPFPSTPFSTSNRAQSAAVYIIYTYDVLNIFMFVFTGSFLSTNLPFFGQISRTSGILVELVIQFLQVIMIGVKFYPILVVADAEPHLLIYLFSSVYMLFIWLTWFFKKALCSRTEAFIKQAFKQAGHEISQRIKSSIGTKLNVSNTFLGLFTDVDLPSETYLTALREKIPKAFKDYFGRYNPNDQSEFTNDDLMLYNSIGGGGDVDSMMLNNYYLMNGDSGQVYQTSSVSTTTVGTTSRTGFRAMLKNKTQSSLETLTSFYYQRDDDFYNFVNVLENLPLYITLSYLLVRYSMLFLSSLTDVLVNWWRYKANYDMGKNKSNKRVKISDPQRYMSPVEIKESIALCDLMIKDLDEGYKEKNKLTNQDSLLDEPIIKKNHNYCYIRNLLGDLNIYGRNSVKEDSFRTTLKESYIYNFFQRRIYRNIPYMKFSKQFINTYTVAFMVIYFFTLFGLRLSNIFGNALVGTIELIYKFIFRGLIPSIDLEAHNFNAEFRTTCLLTSFIVFFQLLSSIKTFHEDLLRLNKGEKFFTSFILRYKDEDYKKIIQKRNKESVTIASDSLHFPGYLVAHLVYGYVLLFLVVFGVVVIFKVFYYLPGAMQTAINLLLPLFILFAFKFVSLEYLIRTIFLRNDKQRITNLAPYYVISYFNFFFDCFLGLVACASRIWQTTIISMIRLPRLDKSMFNREDDLLMRRLDKGHLAYLNYVRMEHWYNNPILNGFCEMLLESMFYSQIYKVKYELMTFSDARFIRHNSKLSQSQSQSQNGRSPERMLSTGTADSNPGYVELDFKNLSKMERMISRTTSLDPSKLMNVNRRVNFELESIDENVNETSRYTKQQSFDLPSSSEYFKQKQRQKRQQKKQQQQPRLQRQSKLKTHSEIIDEVEEDNETSSSTPPRDEQQVSSTLEEHGTPAKIEKGGRKNSSSKKQKGRKTHSEIVDDIEEEQNATTSTTNQIEEEVEKVEEVEEDIAAYYEENNEDSDDEYEDDYENVGSPVDPNDLEVLNRAPANINFEYKSFLRLRNIIYLALLLRKNPSLRKYRFHYLQEMKRREAAMKSRVQSSSELFNEKFEKLKQKLNWRNFNLFKSSSTGTSSTDTSQPPNVDDDFPSTPTDNGNNEPLVRSSRVRTSSL